MIDYEKVDKLVENCKKLYPDMPDYVLWVLACDYYIHEENDDILALEGSPARKERWSVPQDKPRENTRVRDEDEDTRKERSQIKKEALEAFLKAKEEFATTKYENIKVV